MIDLPRENPPDAMAVDAFPPERDWEALFEQLYLRLKAMASRQLGRHGPATLQTTALVHEAYLRMRKAGGLAFAEREQLFAYAARAMRHLLLDRARDRLRATDGALAVPLETDDPRLAVDGAEDAITLDAALNRLATTHPRAAKVVELRYFGGLSLEETADVLGVARTTVDRDWRFARAWLNAGFAPPPS
jgi:RNA polymerase sigma factor (TIGR02999 family)